MINRATFVLGVSLASAAAAAQGLPSARAAALLERDAAFFGAPLLPLASIPAPAPAVEDSLVPPGLWATLAPPDGATRAWLSQRIPGVSVESVRTLTPAAAEVLFAAAMARGLSGLDFFTDAGFRSSEAFYIPQDGIAAIFDRYELRVLTPGSGTTDKGRPFRMQGLVIGRGRIDALYDSNQFSFDNPYFDDGRYKLDSHVTEYILGPGDMTVQGVSIHIGIFQPEIQRITKISRDQARVHSNYGDRVKPLRAIRLRAP